jgi:CHAT domain-containing protein/Tol biopolymer transport system component/Tfp pilus assembly protein PilF
MNICNSMDTTRFKSAQYTTIYFLATILCFSCSNSKYVEEYPETTSSSPQIPSNPIQITAGTESNFAPNLSPNGAYVIYTSDKTGNKDLWEKSTQGGYIKQLTFHSADDFNPVLSPNGDKIAFVSRRQDATGDIEILSLNSINFSFGTNEKSENHIRGLRLPLSEETTPEWFPNSEQIVFSSRKPGEKTPQIMIVDIDNLSTKPLDARGDQPSVSPNGKLIAYVRDGALYIYDLDSEKTLQLTEGGLLQDGQPRFTPDGNSILFIRYADDTNDDGLLNADDRSTIWRLDLNLHYQEKNKENYLIYPLTSANFAAYYPQVRGSSLYLTLQNQNGLDIFKIPSTGQSMPPEDLASLRNLIENSSENSAAIYLMRIAEANFYRNKNYQLSAEVGLMHLENLSKYKRIPEFHWNHKKYTTNYNTKTGYILMSNLLELNLLLNDFNFGFNPPDISPEQIRRIKEVNDSLTKILSSSDKDKDVLRDRINAYGLLLKAKIYAARKEYFKSYEEVSELVKRYPGQMEICADAELFQASILSNTSDLQNSLQKIKYIGEKYASHKPTSLSAGRLAVNLIKANKENEIELLTRFKEDCNNIPIIPAVIHSRIAEIYESEGKNTVYVNELRQIADSYTDSDEIVLKATEKLMGLEEASSRYDEIANTVSRLMYSTNNFLFRSKYRDLYLETMIHHGENLLRNGQIDEACRLFEKVIALQKDHIGAHRGFIDCKYKLGHLDTVLNDYKIGFINNPTDAFAAYNYGYALTYLIDGQESPRVKVSAIDDAIDQVEIARMINSQIIQIHQTLGWLYFQRGYWQSRYYKSGAIVGKIRQKTNLFLSFFGNSEPNWLQMSIESYQTAYYLSRENSFERITIALNLGQTYYEMKNFQKSLMYYLERIKKLEEIPLRDSRSEALLLRRAGRSAFQIDELPLAADLQKAALSAFENLNDKDGINYSLDALALTLREMGKYKDAISLYERLERSISNESQPLNHIAVLSNIGYCYFSDRNYDLSLQYFDSAEEKIKQLGNTQDPSFDDEHSSIKVDLGGQGSAAKGFDLFARGNLILSFKAAIFGKLDRKDLQLESLKNKLDLMTIQRDSEISEGGKSEKYLAEEIAILQNNIAMIELDLGFQMTATKNFKLSELMASKLRPEDQKYKSTGELINATNAHRLNLRSATLGQLKKSEVNNAILDLEETAKSLKSVYDEGAREYGSSINNLLSLSSSFRDLIKSDTKILESNLSESVRIIEKEDISIYQSSKTLLAYNSIDTRLGDRPTNNNKSDIKSTDKSIQTDLKTIGQENRHFHDLIHESKEELLKYPEHKWKIYVLDKDYSAALNEVQSNLLKGISIKNPVDRSLFRYLHEIKLRQSLPKGELETFNALRHLVNNRNLEIVVRNLGNKSINSDDLKKWAKIEPLEEIFSALKNHEHALLFYRFMNGDLLSFSISSKGLSKSEQFFSAGQTLDTWPAEKIRLTKVLSAKFKSSILNLEIKPRDFLYIVPVAELHDIPWEEFELDKLPLKLRNPISFIPSIDLIPAYNHAKRLPNSWVGWLNNFPIEQDQKSSWFSGILSPLQKFDEIKPDGEKPIASIFQEFNIVHISNKLELNPVETSKTSIFLKVKTTNKKNQGENIAEEKKIDSYKDDFIANDLLNTRNKQTLTIVFENTKLSTDENYSTGEGQDGWVFLSLASLKAGIPSFVINLQSNLSSDESKNEGSNIAYWSKFYEILSKKTPVEAVHSLQSSFTRLYGHFGIRDSDAKAYASEQLAEALSNAEDAYDEGEFTTAASNFKDAQFYKDILSQKDNDTLDRIVDSLVQLRNYPEALRFKMMAIDRLKPNPTAANSSEMDPNIYGDGLIEAAVLAVRGKRHLNAAALLDEAERIFEKENNLSKLGKIFHYRGIDAENQQDYDKTIYWYKKSQEYFQKLDSPESIQRSLNIGNVYNTKLSEYAKAIEYFDQAEEGFKRLGSSDYLPVLIDKASALSSVGQIEEATILLERAVIPRIDINKDRDLWIRSTQLLANFYLRAGLLSQALELNAKTIAETEKLDDPIDKLKGTRRRIDAINLKGYILSAMGNYSSGFEEFKDAINLAEQNGLKSQLAVLYNNYGFWAREYGAIDDSLKFFDIALKYDEALKSKSGIAYDQRNIALSTILKGDFNRARELLNTSLESSEKLTLIYNILYCHFGLGDIALRERKFNEAISELNKALEIARKYNFKEFQWKSLAGLAEAEYQQKNWENAARLSNMAISIIETFRGGLKSESSNSNLQSEKGVQEVYQIYAISLMQSGNIPKSWQIAEKSRGRSFLDSIGSKNLELANKEGHDLIKEEASLRRQQDSQQILYEGIKNRNPSDIKIESTKKVLNEITQKRIDIIKKMHRIDRKLLDFVTNIPITLKDVQEKLEGNQGIIEYFVTRDYILSWFISNTSIKHHIIQYSRSDLMRKVNDFRILIQNYSSTDYFGQDLAKLLIEPFLTDIKNVKHIILIPHRDLHFLSFAALPIETKFLIDTVSISYLDTAGSLRDLSKDTVPIGKHSSIAAFVNPKGTQSDLQDLPFAEKEANVLKRYFNKVDIWHGKEADEQKLKSNLNHDILHIGAHGTFFDKFPETSHIVLAADKENDGYLTIKEIFNLKIKAKLVTLSACDSGMGSISSGDEIVAMNKAFLFSGATTVVSALWRINDVTSAVTMKRFYRNLSQGMSKDEALVNAQKIVRKYFKHPGYWAPFRIIGDWH